MAGMWRSPARWAVLAASAWLGAASDLPDVQATIDNFSFNPLELEVPAGTTVIWSNRDDIPHTVTSAGTSAGASAGGQAFASPPLDTGDQFSARFDHAGRFAYFCSLHAHMQGVVIVR